MTPEKLIDLAVYLSIKTTEDATLNSVSNLIGILTGKVSLAITRQVLLSATTDTKTEWYKDISQALTNLVKPLKTLRPFDAEYSHKKVIEIPLAKADIQPSDWAKKTENEKIKTITDKPDDSILDDEMDKKWLIVPKGQLTFDVEGNDTQNHFLFTRTPHIPHDGNGKVFDNSGITIGRGLDLGKRDADEIEGFFNQAAQHAKPISPALLNWLKGGAGKRKQAGYEYWKTLDAKVPKAEQEITRKMQHHLFNVVYATYADDAKRLSTKPDVCKKYLNDNKIDWDALPQNIKEVLIDLTYRGDYTGTEDKRGNTRKIIVPAVYKDQIEENSGLSSKLFKVLQNEKLWKGLFQVDRNRFEERMEHL